MSEAGHTHAPGATRQIAEFIVSLEAGALPHAVVGKIKQCMLDGIACCVFGATLEPVRKLIALAEAEKCAPVSSIIGSHVATSASMAALVNATSAHAFQLDEVHLESTLHAGSIALPTALALAEAKGGVTGAELVAAIVVGYEVGIRVGLAAKGGMFKSGFHNQGTTGVFVSAATAARLLRLGVGETCHALGLAASQAAGLMAVQDGAMAKSFHSGRAAQSGIYAAQLAKRGYTGIPDVLSPAYGNFLSSFLDDWSAPALTHGLGSHWHTMRVGFKPAPAANGSITAMTAIDRIMREHGLTAGDIAHVTARVSDNTLHHCGWPYSPDRVQGVLSAQMSLRYGLAVMALEREATPAQYSVEKIRSPEIMRFIDRITVEHEPEFDGGDGRHRVACRLVVTTTQGATCETIVLYRKGSPEDPMTDDELRSKFGKLAGSLGCRQLSDICTALGAIEAAEDTHGLCRLLAIQEPDRGGAHA